MPIYKTLTDILTTFLVKLLCFLSRVLPKNIALKILNNLISLVFYFVPRFKKACFINLGIAFPELSFEEKELLYIKSKNVLANNFYYFSQIPYLTEKIAKELCDYTEAKKVLKSARDKTPKTGLLIVSMHAGCSEYFLQIHRYNDRKIAVLNRLTGMKRLDTWWNKKREMHGHEMFSRKGGYREIVKRLKAGQDILVLSDQNVKKNYAEFVDFFGLKAATTRAVALASIQTGARVLLSKHKLESDGSFSAKFIELSQPLEIEGSKEEKIHKSCFEMNQEFEKHIKDNPETWFWLHRRWKTRPEEENENIY